MWSWACGVGLDSGQVIAGEIGSGAWGYTTIGEQVGMAQRMESVASSDEVMLSESTARLVDGAAALGQPEMVRINPLSGGGPAVVGLAGPASCSRHTRSVVAVGWRSRTAFTGGVAPELQPAVAVWGHRKRWDPR